MISLRVPAPERVSKETILQEAIKKEIKYTSRRMIAKMVAKIKVEEYRERIGKRTGSTPFPVIAPTRTNDHFDPYFCAKNCNVISKVIWARIQKGTYRPELARTFDIPRKTEALVHSHPFQFQIT